MAEVPSTFQLKPGQQAPDFTLPDGTGTIFRRDSLISGKKGLLVAFVCNHCPYVVHLAEELGDFADEIAAEGIQTVAISANDVDNYPADSPEKMVKFAKQNAWNFPYLYDATQDVAKSYAAACTPDFYLFNSDLALTYAGQFDDTRPKSGKKPTGADLRAAVEKLLEGETAPEPWYPSTGCNIKWKPGQEPDYFG